MEKRDGLEMEQLLIRYVYGQEIHLTEIKSSASLQEKVHQDYQYPKWRINIP